MLLARSLLFNVIFYINVTTLMTATLPALVLPRRYTVAMTKVWGRTSLWLLRVLCDIHVEWRGLERIPPGPLIVAAKHQSAWETFALLPLFSDPTYMVKRELLRLPLFGWLARKAQMIAVDRGTGKKALMTIITGTKQALDEGRQIVVFPEGTRRAAGAEPDYKSGIAHVYVGVDAVFLPVALNSGLFWPRRSFLRYPGTIVVEFLEPIAPGLHRKVFLERLENVIEDATARLVADGRRELAARGYDVPPT